MTKHHHKRKGRPVQSNRVWIEPEINEELDPRKLARAYLALALHRASLEAEAESEHETVDVPPSGDDNAGA
jgi:hypothetical protein